MAETYPTEVSLFKVVGRLLRGIADSPDSSQFPDVVPIMGAQITFTPDLKPPIFRVPTADEPKTFFVESVIATTDEDGYLCIPNDVNPGVYLPSGYSPLIIPTGWSWTVKISVGGNFPDRIFSITGSPDTVVDLATVVPVPANPGVDIAHWAFAVDQATSARDAAVTARTQAVSAKTAAESARDAAVTARDSAVSAASNAAAEVTDTVKDLVDEEASRRVPELLADDPTIHAAAVVAVEAAADGLDIVLGTDPRLPKAGIAATFRVKDNAHQVAFQVNPDGTVDVYDLYSVRRTLGDVTEEVGYPNRYTIKDTAGRVAFQVRENGKTFIGDPEFGREIFTPVTKVILVVVAGQSNAEGRGRPYGPRLDRPHRRLKMWNWPTQTIVPATVPLSSQQQQTGMSIGSVVAREFVNETDDSTIVVILNVAAGGSGIITNTTQGNWDPDYTGSNPKLFTIATTAIASTLAALATQYPGVPVEKWLFWHQGEADNGASEVNYATVHDKIINGLRNALGDATTPVTAGGLVPENGPGNGVRRALFAVQTRHEYAAYTDGIPNGGGSQNVTDTVHYGREGVIRLGKNMYQAALRAATATNTSVPHKPLDVYATFIQGVLNVKWSEPLTRYTNFVVEYSVDGGSWITATRVIPTETAQVVSGLSGSVVQVRVSTVNGSLTSESTIPVTALGV